MSVYSAVAGGILAFGATDLDTNSPVFYALISFLIAITFFGFFLNLRWAFAFECHRNRVNKLAGALWPMIIADILPDQIAMDIPQLGFFRVLKTRILFPLFYLIVLIGITLLLCFVIETHTWMKWLLFVIPSVALSLGVWWCFLLKGAK